jgi:hypothetical protein
MEGPNQRTSAVVASAPNMKRGETSSFNLMQTLSHSSTLYDGYKSVSSTSTPSPHEDASPMYDWGQYVDVTEHFTSSQSSDMNDRSQSWKNFFS